METKTCVNQTLCLSNIYLFWYGKNRIYIKLLEWNGRHFYSLKFAWWFILYTTYKCQVMLNKSVVSLLKIFLLNTCTHIFNGNLSKNNHQVFRSIYGKNYYSLSSFSLLNRDPCTIKSYRVPTKKLWVSLVHLLFIFGKKCRVPNIYDEFRTHLEEYLCYMYI